MNEKEFYQTLGTMRNSLDNGIKGIGDTRKRMLRSRLQEMLDIMDKPDYYPDTRSRVELVILFSMIGVFAFEAAFLAVLYEINPQMDYGLPLLVLFLTIVAYAIISIKKNAITEKIIRSGSSILYKLLIPQKNEP